MKFLNECLLLTNCNNHKSSTERGGGKGRHGMRGSDWETRVLSCPGWGKTSAALRCQELPGPICVVFSLCV